MTVFASSIEASTWGVDQEGLGRQSFVSGLGQSWCEGLLSFPAENPVQHGDAGVVAAYREAMITEHSR